MGNCLLLHESAGNIWMNSVEAQGMLSEVVDGIDNATFISKYDCKCESTLRLAQLT